MTIPSEFFTPESIFTLAGATVITTVITNSCQHVFKWNPKWFGLVVAIVITVAGVFASAAGIMQMIGNPVQPSDSTPRSFRDPRRRFLNQWF